MLRLFFYNLHGKHEKMTLEYFIQKHQQIFTFSSRRHVFSRFFIFGKEADSRVIFFRKIEFLPFN